VQAICDHNLLYREVYGGQPGTFGDNLTYERSPVSSNVYDERFLAEDEHILGDGAYTLTRQVIY